MALRLSRYLSKGLPVTVQLKRDDQPRSPLLTIIGEVRWGRPRVRGFVHGIQIKNLSREEREELVDRIRRGTLTAHALPALKVA